MAKAINYRVLTPIESVFHPGKLAQKVYNSRDMHRNTYSENNI